MGTRLVNLTPLTVRIKASKEPDAPIITLEGCATPAKLSVTVMEADSVNGMRAVRNVFGPVENLPDPCENTLFIVTLPVGERFGCRHGREDMIGPNTNDAEYIVNEKGARVIDYCYGWVRY